MKRALRYEGRIHKDLKRLDAGTQVRILSALEGFAATGDGDVRPMRGEFAGSYRLRVGKWRVYVGGHRISDRQPRRSLLMTQGS
jgi:mRNA-degrading endonuclease RelE of RelBE toxin-antitoxin system